MNLFVPVIILCDRVMVNRLTDLETIVRAIFDRFNLPSGPTAPERRDYRKRGGGCFGQERWGYYIHCTPDTITEGLRFPEVFLRDGYLWMWGGYHLLPSS